jgi:hypothetical protein
VVALGGCDGRSPVTPSPGIAAPAGSACPLGPALATDGHRRLALVVGVGRYRSPRVTTLRGAPEDARRVYQLLTGPDGYGFPTENVCLLLDEDATTARVREAFEAALVERAGPDDVALFYYAGHGSQTPDLNGDEPDGQDETFLFHDARSDGVRDFPDDELNPMLARLTARTRHAVVVLDSCNSGTAARGPEAGTLIARFQPPADAPAPGGAAPGAGETGAGWVPEDLPGLVLFTAASDGTSALERAGRGIFTDALLRTLAQVGRAPLTYAQAARQIAPQVAAQSNQIPYFQGDLGGPVLGNTARSRPLAWEVTAVGAEVVLAGPPLPGIGPGAELRVYPGGASPTQTRDPAAASATVVVREVSGLNARARVASRPAGAPAVQEGDLALLVRPGDDALRLRVRLRPEREPGGLPAERAQALRASIAADPEAHLAVEPTDGPGDFELAAGESGLLVLRGPENTVRNLYRVDREVARSLWQHARQRALLQLRGEGGADFSDDQTLEVRLGPAPGQGPCARGAWRQAAPGAEQVIPLCHRWQVQVALSREASVPLLVGGVVLSTDGGLLGFPADGRSVRLRPGERVTFSAAAETFTATPPLQVRDQLIVFGTQETNPVPWHLLTDTAATRAAGPPLTGLYRALDRYLQPGSRGAARAVEAADERSWTLSHLSLRVVPAAAPGPDAAPALARDPGGTAAALAARPEDACDPDAGCPVPEP